MIPEVAPKSITVLLQEWTVVHPVVAGVALLFALLLFGIAISRCHICYKSRLSDPHTGGRTPEKRSAPRKVTAVQLDNGELVTQEHASILDTVFSVDDGGRSMSDRFWDIVGRGGKVTKVD